MKKPATKDKLIRAATDLFYRKGYADTSIQDIGARAGMSASLVYHYFGSKEKLLFEIIEKTRDSFETQLREALKDEPNPMKRLERIIRVAVIQPCKEAKKETKIFLSDNYWLTRKHKHSIKQRERELYDIVVEQLEEARARGLMKDLPSRIVAFNIIGMLNWSYRWYRSEGTLRIEDVADVIVAFVTQGIAER